ncbi:MAG: peptide chain release factor-like protein [Verrucomicrobiaceae bacterium]|nr:MAG: peptide chain release factor-like protein [Verrucomicrobiaceae bacterium]
MSHLRDEDIVEQFARSSGPGGQHVNKVSTAVTLRHIPTGLSVTVTTSRSQAMNRAEARRRLAEKIAGAARARKLNALAEAARDRRRKARRSRGTKARLVESKRRRGETKKMRGKVNG